MKFGAVLKACRIRAGLSQEELADKLYVNQSDISKFESDRKEPTISIFHAWLTNTQSPEVMVAFLYGMDGLNMIQHLMPLLGGFIINLF